MEDTLGGVTAVVPPHCVEAPTWPPRCGLPAGRADRALGGVHAGLRRETWVVGHHLAGEVDAIALSHYVAGLVGAAELHPHPIGLAGPGPEALIGGNRLHQHALRGGSLASLRGQLTVRTGNLRDREQ